MLSEPLSGSFAHRRGTFFESGTGKGAISRPKPLAWPSRRVSMGAGGLLVLVIREEQMRRLEEVLSPGIFQAKMLMRLQGHSNGQFTQCSDTEIAAFVSSGQR